LDKFLCFLAKNLVIFNFTIIIKVHPIRSLIIKKLIIIIILLHRVIKFIKDMTFLKSNKSLIYLTVLNFLNIFLKIHLIAHHIFIIRLLFVQKNIFVRRPINLFNLYFYFNFFHPILLCKFYFHLIIFKGLRFFFIEIYIKFQGL
jgi:hypothetical protein